MLGDENDVEIVAAAAANPEAGNVHNDEQDAEEEEARQVQPVVEEDQGDDEVADTDVDGPPLLLQLSVRYGGSPQGCRWETPTSPAPGHAGKTQWKMCDLGRILSSKEYQRMAVRPE
jgi:Fe-S cluster biogenesis protein NfuA